MTLLDDRILISAPPEVVWELLGSLDALHKWHGNCTQASILTTQQRGTGTRCRMTMDSGPDQVLEILSWYENLGYEYTLVDGPRYRSNKGRIRLQVIPEGTVVQWTFEYTPQGFLAGLRNRLFTRRRLAGEISASLKRLKRAVESTGIRMDAATRDRVSMRPAPNATERAALAERQPTPPAPAAVEPPPAAAEATVAKMPPVSIPEAAPAAPEIFEDDLPILPGGEPPLSDEDTRPNPPTVEALPEPPVEPQTEPPADQTQPRRPVGLSTETAKTTVPPASEAEPDFLEESLTPGFLDIKEEPPPEEPAAATQAVAPPPPPEAPPPPTERLPQPVEAAPEPEPPTEPKLPVVEPEPAPAPPPPEPEPAAQNVEPTPPPDSPAPERKPQDVGPSIWDVFGITPPSQTTIAPAQTASAEDPYTRAEHAYIPSTWRVRARRPADRHPGRRRQQRKHALRPIHPR